MRRADASFWLHDIPESATVHGVVATDRHHHGVRAQELRHHHPREVAVEETNFARRRPEPRFDAQDERPVAVAVGRHHGIQRAPGAPGLRGQGLNLAKLRLLDILRIDRDKGLAASRPDDLGANPAQEFHQQIAAHRRVLIYQEPFALEAAAGEEIRIAAQIGQARARLLGRQLPVSAFEQAPLVERRGAERLGVKLPAQFLRTVLNRRLIRLQQLAPSRVGLVAVAIERNVAAGNHDAAPAAFPGKSGQRRRRDPPDEDRLHPGSFNCRRHRLGQFAPALLLGHKSARTGPQVAGKIKLLAPDDPAFAHGERLQIPQFRQDVEIDLELGQVGHQAAPAAGAELQRRRFVVQAGTQRRAHDSSRARWRAPPMRPASSMAATPVRKMPSNFPAPPIEAIGAPIPLTRLRFSKSAPTSVPMLPAT